MVATDLIAGWWRTDRLFCIAVAFLALVFAATTVSGVIMLLQRRGLGRYLITAGAVVALLTYGGVFIAGARVAWIVHALPVLPIASVVLALHPQHQALAAGLAPFSPSVFSLRKFRHLFAAAARSAQWLRAC